MKTNSKVFAFGLIASWYSSNIGVLLLNKFLLSNYGFKYPIFLTMCHMTACSLLSYIAIAWMKMVPMQTIRSRVQFLKISALSLVFCVSVVLGNISLRFLAVSFNQAVGATTQFSGCWGYDIEEGGLAYVYYPYSRCYWGYHCQWATAARALKSVLQGILLSSEGEKLNSMNLLLYMAPIAVVFLLPAALIMEENVVGIALALARDDAKIIWYLLFNSALAYFVNLTNFLVTKHTSALTLQAKLRRPLSGRVWRAPPSPLPSIPPRDLKPILGFTFVGCPLLETSIFSDVVLGASQSRAPRRAYHTLLRLDSPSNKIALGM
ncbi:hypothetical protein V6N13_140989 [Hibiscus sabdariffa]